MQAWRKNNIYNAVNNVNNIANEDSVTYLYNENHFIWIEKKKKKCGIFSELHPSVYIYIFLIQIKWFLLFI